MPPFFIQVVRQRASLCCTTKELADLNTSQQGAMEEVLRLSTIQVSGESEKVAQ